MKSNALILLLLWSSGIAAQPDYSFESYDSLNRLRNWTTVSGTVNRQTVRMINHLPFSATDGLFFLFLESDTGSVNDKAAVIRGTFAFNNRPKSFGFDCFYLPTDAAQSGKVQVHMFRSPSDTILFTEFPITAVFDPDSPGLVPIRWNTYNWNLNGLYRSDSIPDSLAIELISEINPAAPQRPPLMLIDHIRFSPFAAGTHEKFYTEYQIYPNPVSTHLFLDLLPSGTVVQLNSVTGKQLTSFQNNKTNPVLNLEQLPTGCYILKCVLPSGDVIYKKIVKSE